MATWTGRNGKGEVVSDAAELPIIAVLIPAGTRERMLSAAAESELATLGRVRNPPRALVTSEDLPALLEGAVVCLTGWGTPPLRQDVLANHATLQLIAHTAGSIRRIVPLEVMQQGLRVTHAAAIIADAVAEFVIGQAMLGLRQIHQLDRSLRAGDEWNEVRERHLGGLLGARTVGVIGAGHVGRAVIRLLQAFGALVLVYDPLLTESEAAALGVERRPLDQVFAESDVVTLHAPVLPQTKAMIGARQLALLRDGALFINTARGALVDEAALLRELRSGRISAALDVFAEEPLPTESPFRQLPNVLLSPHAAGHTVDTYRRQGQAMVDEVGRLLRGESLRYEITPAMLPTMA
jgi:phosphoglycerate dehydrogenase-like enzyme